MQLNENVYGLYVRRVVYSSLSPSYSSPVFVFEYLRPSQLFYVHCSELQYVLQVRQVSSLGYQFEFATIRLPRILCPLSPHLLGNIPLDCDIVLQQRLAVSYM